MSKAFAKSVYIACAWSHLTKSIYISRLETTVTSDKIMKYIKNKLPELNETDIALRMLVKKGQVLDELTFSSYRLHCTEENCSTFLDSSFWPEHVVNSSKENVSQSILATSLHHLKQNHLSKLSQLAPQTKKTTRRTCTKSIWKCSQSSWSRR